MTESDLNKYFLTKKIPYVKPFYAIKWHEDKEILGWFKDAEHILGEYYRPLFREQHENLQLFVGSGLNPNFCSPYTATFATTSDIYAEPQQLFINEVYRATMDQISLIISHDLIPDVLPNSEDYSDKTSCNIVKEWLDSMSYDLDIEACRFRWELAKKMFGEIYTIVMWNPNKGDLHPYAKEFDEEELPLLDEEGNEVLSFNGESVKLKKRTRVGDIEFVTPFPWDVMFDPQPNYDASCWFYWKEYVDVDYLKKKYPKFNWDQTKQLEKYYDPFSNSEKDNPSRRTIFYFFHKSHEFLPEGRFIIASKDYVLLNEPMTLPTLVDSQTLPIVRFMDMDIWYGSRGIPILFRNVKNVADAYNRVTNQIYNNLEMESPKLFVHRTSGVDAQRMPNGSVAIEWDGNIKPTIETPSTNSSGIFAFRDSLKKNIDEISLQNPMVRGDTPNAQMDSFVSLQYFEDIRNQLASPDIKGHIRSMEHLFRLMITIAKDKYKPEDGRLIKILGKHNTYQLKYFDPINLQKSYDVKISSSGNLANSKAARSQMIITIKRDFPNIISDELFLDMLGLSHSKKFMNAITAAVSSAEAENQDMFNGEQVLSPARFEDLITHWETHRIPMQTLDFKQAPEEVKDLFIGHVAATEKLMFEQAGENPVFQQRLAGLRQFPMIYTPVPVNEMPPNSSLMGEQAPEAPVEQAQDEASQTQPMIG